MNHTQDIGRLGENAAAQYLKRNHYRILERNFRDGKNEIDIIAENREYIVFAEVKTRTVSKFGAGFGRPASAVHSAKQRCTLACAEAYLVHSGKKRQPRMDVIEVYVSDHDGKPTVERIEHMENAYGY